MAVSSSNNNNSQSLMNELREETKKTINAFEDLKSQKGQPYRLLKEAIESKQYINSDYVQEIKRVQRFHSEVLQFEEDVKHVVKSRDIKQKDIAEEIFYEEDDVEEDAREAAKAVIEIKGLRDRCIKKKKKFKDQGEAEKALVMSDTLIMVEVVLRDLSYYFTEAYYEMHTLARQLAKEENYSAFRKEIEKMEEDPKIERAEEIIKEEFGSPSALEGDRYSKLEKKARKLRQQA